MRHVLAALSLVLAGDAALAQSLDASDATRLHAIVKACNASAELTKDDVGDPKLRVEAHGVTYSVFFYGCSAGRYCRTLQFQVGLDLDSGLAAEEANRWNRERRFASTYLDDENDPFLQMDLIMEYAMTEENFREAVRVWEASLADFLEFVDW